MSMGQQNTNPMDLVEQINDQTDYYAETTSEGKIAVKEANGVVQYEISNGKLFNYSVVKDNGVGTSVDTNNEVLTFIQNT